MKCEYCGTAIPDGAEECPACGAGITIQTEKPADWENASGRKTIKCRKCKTENDSTMQFCGHCGEALNPDPHDISYFEFQLFSWVSIFMGWVGYKVLTHFRVPDSPLDWWVLGILVVAIFFLSLFICIFIRWEIQERRKKTTDKER